jgi:hypothetical protein
VKRLHAVILSIVFTVGGTSGMVQAAGFNDPFSTTTTTVAIKQKTKKFSVVHKNGVVVPKSVLSKIPKDKTKRCPKWEPLLDKYGLPPQVFSYVMWRESRCNPKSINAVWKNGKVVWTLNRDGSYDSGLMQINSSWKTLVSQTCKSKYGDLQVLLSPNCNLMVATVLFAKGKGFSNWSL